MTDAYTPITRFRNTDLSAPLIDRPNGTIVALVEDGCTLYGEHVKPGTYELLIRATRVIGKRSLVGPNVFTEDAGRTPKEIREDAYAQGWKQGVIAMQDWALEQYDEKSEVSMAADRARRRRIHEIAVRLMHRPMTEEDRRDLARRRRQGLPVDPPPYPGDYHVDLSPADRATVSEVLAQANALRSVTTDMKAVVDPKYQARPDVTLPPLLSDPEPSLLLRFRRLFTKETDR